MSDSLSDNAYLRESGSLLQRLVSGDLTGQGDETAALQALLSALPDGGTLDLWGKSVGVSAALTLSNRAGVTLRNGTLRCLGAMGRVLTVTDCPGLRVNGLTFDGQNQRVLYALEAVSCPELSVSACTFKRTVKPAADALTVGLYLKPGCDRAVVTGCVFADLDGAGGAARGVYVNSPNPGGVVRGVRVVNSVFRNFSDVVDSDGVVFGALDSAHGSVVSGNSFENFGKRAVKVQAPGVAVTGNSAHQSQAVTAFAFVSVYADDVTVLGNTFSGAAPADFVYGITVEGGCKNVVVEGNTLTFPAARDALYVSGAADGIAVVGNTFNVVRYGVHLQNGASNLTVSGNVFRGVTTRGVFSYAGQAHTGLVVTGNSFSGAGSPLTVAGSWVGCVYANNRNGCAFAAINDTVRVTAGAGLLAENNTLPNGTREYDLKAGKLHSYRTSVPASETWAVGDVVHNLAPAAGGNIGWVCTAAGTPGTFKAFGTIAV